MKKILLLISLVVLTAAGCESFADPSMNNIPENSASTNTVDSGPDISNWKIYKNDKLGFQISYPDNYKVVENPTDQTHKDSIIYLANQEAFDSKSDKVYGQIYVKKVRNSLKNQNNSQFSWQLLSLGKVNSIIDDQTGYLMYSYFTADAYSSSRAYILSSTSPRNPGDDGSEVGDVLVATVSSSTDDVIPDVTTPDWIARTMKFTK